MDQAITKWINGLAGTSPVLDAVMIAITTFGAPLLVGLVIVQWWAQSDRQHVRHTCLASGLAFLLGLGFNQIILLFVHRLRPYDVGVSQLLVAKSPDWSFPSDHATAVVAIAASFALQALPRRAVLFSFMAALICVSRVFVGTHYVSDILGGAAIGLVAAWVVRTAYREGTPLDLAVTRLF